MFRVFLEDTLHLEMSENKTKITHSKDKARFLGYDVTTSRKSGMMYDSKNQLRKTHTGLIKLYAPRDKWQNKLLDYGALQIRYDVNGKEIWDSHHRGRDTQETREKFKRRSAAYANEIALMCKSKKAAAGCES